MLAMSLRLVFDSLLFDHNSNSDVLEVQWGVWNATYLIRLLCRPTIAQTSFFTYKLSGRPSAPNYGNHEYI
jgi:hypothetical protein